MARKRVSDRSQRLTPAAVNRVTFDGGFWGSRMAVNRAVTLPAEYAQCRRTGRLEAFKLNWKPGQPRRPHVFWDSDVAKWIEAAAYALAQQPDRTLSRRVDEVIDWIAAAQQPDGYLNTHFTVVALEKRWSDLRDAHELYCAGHLMEAAVAYAEATGKDKLLHVLCRYADYIARTFGRGKGQRRGYCGHPEIELALARLARATGERRYLELARYFVDERGQRPSYFDREACARGEDPSRHWLHLDHYQAHAPVREQHTVEGHAVRALYLLAGMVDVASETGDAGLMKVCREQWRNVTQRRMYLTGGVGSAPHGERFTFDYDLPNETAYAETCAAIALVMTAHRFLQVTPDREYADVMERGLYNGIPSGISLTGDRFFYANPLTVVPAAERFMTGPVKARRQPWFDCACCPPNIARLFASLGPYAYATARGRVYVHLYAQGTADLDLDGARVKLAQRTRYPWDGAVRLTVSPDRPAKFALCLRMPGWCVRPTVRVNGRTLAVRSLVRGYLHIERRWQTGDTVELDLPMPIRCVVTHPHCRNNAGRMALQRGPVVYCLEEVDNGPDLHSLVLAPRIRLTARFAPKLLGGVTVIHGTALRPVASVCAADALYADAPASPALRRVALTAVPYCVWGNRKPGEMTVWMR